MRVFRVPYGSAITINVGSLRVQADGLLATPSWQAGDVKVMNDAGNAFENADDATPGLVGTSILLDVSAAEASPPAALAGARLYQFIDQAGAAWIDEEVKILTEDHPLAWDTMGCIAAGTLHASSQTTINIRLGAAPQNSPRAGMFGVLSKAANAPIGFFIESYDSGDPFNIVPRDAVPASLDNTWAYKIYQDAPSVLARVLAEENIAFGAAKVAQIPTAAATATATETEITDRLPTAATIVRFNAREALGFVITVGAGAHTTTNCVASDQASKELDGAGGIVLTGTNGGRRIRFTSDSDGSGAFTYTDWFDDAFVAALAENDTIQA